MHRTRRTLRRLAILLVVAGILAPATAGAAAPRVEIDVVKVSGLLDPLNADLLHRAISTAVKDRAGVLVVQLNSNGGVLSRARLAALISDERGSPVPVAVWVGGSGAPHATGQAFEIVAAAAYSGTGPSATVGPDGGTASSRHAAIASALRIAAPTLGDFVVDLDGVPLAGHAPLHIADVVRQGGQPRRQVSAGVVVVFSQLTVIPKLLHSAASPNVAFVMLVLALCLVLFEFFTAGVGVAAATGAMFGVLSAYGLGVLPTRPWAVALMMLAAVGFAIDVQSGAPRVWTVIGGAAFVVGGVWLYDGWAVSPWVLVLTGLLLMLFMVSGMPAMVRTRFSTPTIGREGMIGTMGTALTGVDPDGTVEIDGAPWRARTNRATPISSGGPVRVVGLDGLVLEVEPEEGGARDAHH